ncbi:MAG: hypothetical protein ABJ308_16805 [Halieaceae bacterium]
MSDKPITRECNGCTACCDGWLQTNVDGCEIGAGKPCKHISKTGCTIYATRPFDPCVGFRCGWLLNDSMPDWMKPNVARVIIKPGAIWERPGSRVRVNLATAVGPRIPGKTIQWLRNYARNERCDFLCHEHVREGKTYTGALSYFGAGSPEFEQEVENWKASGYDFTVTASNSTMVIGDKFFKQHR